jgi:hypothetical protein
MNCYLCETNFDCGINGVNFSVAVEEPLGFFKWKNFLICTTCHHQPLAVTDQKIKNKYASSIEEADTPIIVEA